MKRVLQKEVVNELSKHLLSGKFELEDTIWVDVNKNKEILFTKKGEKTKKSD